MERKLDNGTGIELEIEGYLGWCFDACFGNLEDLIDDRIVD